jgi:trans-aconitate methyltransferase
MAEQNAIYYDEKFANAPGAKAHYSESHYYPLWTVIAREVCLSGDNPSVLDIGCGAGHLAHLLSDQGIQRYTGLDFSKERINHAKSLCTNFSFECEDIHDNRLLEESDYDIVIATEFFEHIEKDIDVLRRIRSGTKVLATVPSYDDPAHVRHFESSESVYSRYSTVLGGLKVYKHKRPRVGKWLYLLEGESIPANKAAHPSR